jgi:energy-coupling factor transporter transmembrane protein EcfT
MMNRNTDIRVKVILVLLFLVCVLLLKVHHAGTLLILSGWLAASAWLSRVEPRVLLNKVIRVYPMIFLVTILIPFSNMGSPEQSTILFLKFNTAGLIHFTEINLKFIMIFICTTIFSLTTTPQQIISGMRSLGMASWVIAVFFLMQRYMVILKTELQRQVNAFRSRYIYLKPVRRVRYFSRLLSIFGVRTFGRAERLYQTMLSRGFNGHIYSRVEPTWATRDSLVLGVNLLFFIMVFLAV